MWFDNIQCLHHQIIKKNNNLRQTWQRFEKSDFGRDWVQWTCEYYNKIWNNVIKRNIFFSIISRFIKKNVLNYDTSQIFFNFSNPSRIVSYLQLLVKINLYLQSKTKQTEKQRRQCLHTNALRPVQRLA